MKYTLLNQIEILNTIRLTNSAMLISACWITVVRHNKLGLKEGTPKRREKIITRLDLAAGFEHKELTARYVACFIIQKNLCTIRSNTK